MIGEVHPDRALTNAGACAGDRAGAHQAPRHRVLSTALKRDALLETGMAEAVRSMTTLNEGAARAALAVGVSAATDVTGFGLLGHLGNMLGGQQESAPRSRSRRSRILPHVLEPGRPGDVPGGSQRNLAAAEQVDWAEDLTPTERIICVDAQTSGGLLLAVPPENEAERCSRRCGKPRDTRRRPSSGGSPPAPRARVRVTRRPDGEPESS